MIMIPYIRLSYLVKTLLKGKANLFF